MNKFKTAVNLLKMKKPLIVLKTLTKLRNIKAFCKSRIIRITRSIRVY